MLRRLPISLRFDDEDSDFYYGFIEQKKNDRELSSLILDLLHVYYENDTVKGIVDDYVVSQNPFIHIHEELQRIALEHSRQTVSTNILNDFNDNARKNISEPPESVNKTPTKPEETDEKSLLLLESKLQQIVEKTVAETFNKMLQSGVSVVGNSQSIVESVGNQIKEELPMNSVLKEDKVKVQVEVEKPIKEVVPIVEKPKVEPPKRAKVESADGHTSVSNPVKKPASFGKLLNSVK